MLDMNGTAPGGCGRVPFRRSSGAALTPRSHGKGDGSARNYRADAGAHAEPDRAEGRRATVPTVGTAVRVLGPLEVVVNGIDVTPRGPKERALLALLALRGGRVVPADRLIEELWPELSPERRAACAPGPHRVDPEVVARGRVRWNRVHQRRLHARRRLPRRRRRTVSVNWSTRPAGRRPPTTPKRPRRHCARRWLCGEANRSPTVVGP